MKIAQVAPAIESVPPKAYGGTELVISNITEGLVKKGHEVHLFATGDSETESNLHPIVEAAIRKSCAPEAYPVLREVYMHLSIGKIMEGLLSEKFDLIHNHLGWRLLPFASLLKVPIVTTIHGTLEGEFNQEVWQHYLGLDYNFVSISDNQRRALPNLHFVETVYNGIQVEKFTFQDQPGEYLAFLGRITPLKGPKEAIQVAKQAGLPLKIAAKVDPIDQEYFKKEIEPLIDGKQIQFLGEVDHAGKVAVLRGAKALLAMIQWEEPFGLFMVEALACGTPVIAIPRVSVPEIIKDGVHGFHAHSVEEAVQAVGRLGKINRMACRTQAERFSVEVMVNKYEKLYRRLVKAEASSFPFTALSNVYSLSRMIAGGGR